MKGAANTSSPLVGTENDIKVEMVCEMPHLIPTLADIWHGALGEHYGPEYPRERLYELLLEHQNPRSIPTSMVALLGKEPVGMCVIRASDEFKPYIVPSLGAMSVRAEYRNHGIGAKLIRAAIKKTVEFGFSRLYLFTVDMTIVEWYERFGFQLTGYREWENGHVSASMEMVIPQQGVA
ncbi:MAG: GNAT family N-acetyltransferase [Proteobacteria bacterium]|nr:GNAT family N-acetyltransferase [Pseudomonadota bacterium]